MVKKDAFKVVYRRDGKKSKIDIDENDTWMDALDNFLKFISRDEATSPGYIIDEETRDSIVDHAKTLQAKRVQILIDQMKAKEAKEAAEAKEAKAAAEIAFINSLP
jgi:Mg/Co/Ni transporter MgtE